MRKNLKEARQVADRLNISLRQYQRVEAGDSNGSFEVWDALEDMLGIHQRILREISDNHPVPQESQSEHQKDQQ